MTLLEILEEQVGLGGAELLTRVLVAPRRYKVYQIPKRSGGQRTIAQPARDLKLLQRVVVDEVLANLPVLPAATAYQAGRSIKANASSHKNSRVILKLDFENFFPSIRVSDFVRYCRALEPDFAARIGLSTDEDLFVAARLLFWGRGTTEPRCLSIGAPSSPVLSNILMLRFDEEVSSAARKYDVTYTRYADDITLSGSSSAGLLHVESAIERHLRRYRSPALKLNAAKRGLYTSGQKRLVTGLVITPEAKVSLGRHRKRAILSLVHRYKLGLLSPASTAQIQGLVAFARDVEPSFVDALTRKYGADVMSNLSRFRLAERAPPPPSDY